MGRIMQMLVDHGADMRQESKDAYMAAGDDVVNAGGDMGFVLRERDQTIGAVYVQAGGDEDGGYEYGGYSMVMADYADNTTAILNRELDQKASLQRKEWDLRAAEMANSRQEWEEKMTAILTRGSKGWVASEDRFLAEWRKWTKEYDREVDDGIEAWKTKIDQHFTDKAAWEDKIRKTTTEANIADVMGSAIDDLNKQLEIAADNLKVNFNRLNKLRAIDDMIAEVRSKDPAGIERLERVNQNISNFSTLIGMSEMLSTDHYSGLTKGGEKSLLSEFRSAMDEHKKNMKVYANAKAFESYQKMLTQLVEQIDKQNDQVDMQTRTAALSAGFIEVGGKYVKKSGSNGFMIAVDKYTRFDGKAALDKELGPNLKSTSEIVEMLKTQDDVEIEAFFYTQRLLTQAAFERIVGRGNAEERKQNKDEKTIGLLGMWIGSAGDSDKKKGIETAMGGSYASVQGNARALGLNFLAGGFGELGASGLRPGGAPMGFYVQLEVYGAELAKQEAKGMATMGMDGVTASLASTSLAYQLGNTYKNIRVQTEVYGQSKAKALRSEGIAFAKAAVKSMAATVASSGGLTGFLIGGAMMIGSEALNANGTFSMNSQKWVSVGAGLLSAAGGANGFGGSANFLGNAISSGFEWDERGHQKGGWSLAGSRGDAFLTQVAISGVAQGIMKGSGMKGPGASLLQGSLTSALTTGVEYDKARRGVSNNFAGIMNQGFGASLGSTLGSLASAGIGAKKAEAAKAEADEHRRLLIKQNAFKTGQSEADIEAALNADIARQANDESQRQMAQGVVLGFARRFTEGFVESTGLQELGQAFGNAWNKKGFATTDTLEQRKAQAQRQELKQWLSKAAEAGTPDEVVSKIRAATPEAKKLGGMVTSESMQKGSELRDKIVAAVAAETKNGTPLSNEALMKICQQFGVSLPALNSPQTLAQAKIFMTTNYSEAYKAQLKKEAPPPAASSGDLSPEFFASLPFKSNMEEVRNGIFAIKMQRHQERMAARERNPEAYKADGSANPWPAFQRWYYEDYDTLSENIHDGLDVAGMVPGFGMIPDGLNVAYHLVESAAGIGTGSLEGAGGSALAFVPILGDGFAAVKNGRKFGKILKIEKYTEPLAEFAGKMWGNTSGWVKNFAATTIEKVKSWDPAGMRPMMDEVLDGLATKAKSGAGLADDAARAGFNRQSILKGFQDHHIISDKNPLTKSHELLDLADFNLQSRANKIFLPTEGSLHSTRSIHLGKHFNSVSQNLARQMDEAVAVGRELGWGQAEYNQALREILQSERGLLRSGQRALNSNARPWSIELW